MCGHYVVKYTVYSTINNIPMSSKFLKILQNPVKAFIDYRPVLKIYRSFEPTGDLSRTI